MEHVTITCPRCHGTGTITKRDPTQPNPVAITKCINQLDTLGVPLTASANACGKALKKAGEGMRRTVILAAARQRHATDPN